MSAPSTSTLPDCRPLLADPDDLTLVFQPIVDLAAARVVGHAALARFPGTAGPEVWFAAAADCGLVAELEALAVVKALAAVPLLAAGTSLTVGVSCHLLGSAPVRDAFAARPDLHGVVVELTAHTPIEDLDALRRQAEELRARGALVALRDAGSGCPGLQAMATVRPELVGVDRALVAGLDSDPVRAALAATVGGFAGRIGARLLAEGVETTGELAALVRLGVPLARGWLLGRPTPDPAPLAPEVADLVRAHAARARLTGTVAGLLRPVRQSELGEPLPGVPPVVLVAEQGEPVGLWLACPRTAEPHAAPVSLRVQLQDDVTDVLHRALARPPAHRFDPVVCTDPTGAVVGLLRVEDLATAVAAG